MILNGVYDDNNDYNYDDDDDDDYNYDYGVNYDYDDDDDNDIYDLIDYNLKLGPGGPLNF